MNKLEKLHNAYIAKLITIAREYTNNEQEAMAAVTGEALAGIVGTLNEAIDHITALASEVDRLKGHDHTSYNLRDLPPSLQKQVIDATPPTMETDKQ